MFHKVMEHWGRILGPAIEILGCQYARVIGYDSITTVEPFIATQIEHR